MNRTLALLVAFAIAMALLESSVVVYMRHLYYPDNPLELFPLQFLDQYDPALELSREAATVIMIVTVALLAECRSLTRSFAAFVFVFGIWDLFYYFWLQVLIGWPTSWLQWDVLFLIPGVWLGPWICPAMIALLFVAWGFRALKSTDPIAFSPGSGSLFVTGAVLGLVTFLQPATAVIMVAGSAELSRYTPGAFWWWLFIPSYLLMLSGFAMTLRDSRRSADRTNPA
jgi:hypothetical protein